MCLFDSQLTADQVLRAYHHDAPLLFLSSAFITVAVVAAAFCAIRRRFDPLLVNLALFAYLYGQRLRFDSSIFHLGISHGPLFLRLGKALFYLVPMPAFGFFDAAGFMGRRGKFIAFSACGILLGLILATLIFGPKHVFDNINNSVVLVSLLAVMIQSFRHGAGEQDVVVLRAGLLCFVVGAFCDNIVGFYRTPQRIEPYGFALFLAALGYVAARRVLRRDQKLADLQSELDLARHIQLSILPGNFPSSTAFRVAARYVPMTSVAGDFYDFIVADDNQAGLLIADVSGHGVPAALIASMVKMAATSQRTYADAPAQLLTGMNAALCGNTQSQFVTAAYIHLDAGTREFSYAAAGHPPMLLLREGRVTEVEENGLMLAILPNAAYTQRSQSLLAGDRLILYTDGIVEAADSRQEFFGQANLHAAVRETATLHPSEAADSIIRSVQKWAPSQDDDLTILVCDFVGPAI